MLEGDDLGGRAFALFLRPHPGAFRQLMCLHPREFAHFFQKKKCECLGAGPGGGGGHGHCWNWLMHYIKQFRDVESSHAWKITSTQWVFLTFNWAYYHVYSRLNRCLRIGLDEPLFPVGLRCTVENNEEYYYVWPCNEDIERFWMTMYFKVIFWNATKLKVWPVVHVCMSLLYWGLCVTLDQEDQEDVGLSVELYMPMCGYIKQFRDVESSHAWKITKLSMSISNFQLGLYHVYSRLNRCL